MKRKKYKRGTYRNNAASVSGDFNRNAGVEGEKKREDKVKYDSVSKRRRVVALNAR